jgi:hypothetical protein
METCFSMACTLFRRFKWHRKEVWRPNVQWQDVIEMECTSGLGSNLNSKHYTVPRSYGGNPPCVLKLDTLFFSSLLFSSLIPSLLSSHLISSHLISSHLTSPPIFSSFSHQHFLRPWKLSIVQYSIAICLIFPTPSLFIRITFRRRYMTCAVDVVCLN